MTAVRDHLHLINAFSRNFPLAVAVVGHSIGSTINIGLGKTTPHRRHSRIGRGYYRRARCDFFLTSACWEIRGRSGYVLRWSDNSRRIAREIGRLVGKTTAGVSLKGSKQSLQLRFSDGSVLKAWSDDNEGIEPGWNFWVGDNVFQLANRASH
ncbi:hypothetical protein [Mesorhizobium sp. IMUNJ 23232]|uniref:hypothetical protein n=1 Tax=Mesorhizobium sp. IMUNJ 23232 TaxID=3376064 RepID=UPI0037A98DFD